MKKFNLLILVLIGMASFLAAQVVDQNIPLAPVPSLVSYSSSAAAPAMPDCSSMTDDEQQFSTQLGAMQKMVFCNKFDSDMRSEAMQMVGQPDVNGNMMSADQAVEKVARENNIMMPSSTMPQSSRGTGGGCPVK